MILYSLPTCGQCTVLKRKLNNKKINFTIIDDIEKMEELGIRGIPVLQLDDGTRLTQIDAIKWVNAQEEK